MTDTIIPTVAEQVELATRAHAVIGHSIQIGDRWYDVVRFHYEIRFFGRAKFRGEIAPDAHVATLRADVVRAAPLPGHNDSRLAAQCETIVARALAR